MTRPGAEAPGAAAPEHAHARGPGPKADGWRATGARTRVLAPLWLTHHSARDQDRCALIGRVTVCRRCLLLWPLTYVVLGLALVGVRWPTSADPVMLVALPVPAVAEFVLEHWGRLTYWPRLQAVVTVPLALALGAGLERYVHHPGDGLFWWVVIVDTSICLTAAYLGAQARS